MSNKMKRAICQLAEAKQPVIWTSLAALFCLQPPTPWSSLGTRTMMQGVQARGGRWQDKGAVPHTVSSQREMYWKEAVERSLVSPYLGTQLGK